MLQLVQLELSIWYKWTSLLSILSIDSSDCRRLVDSWSLALTPHTSYIYNNLRATVFQTFGLSKNVENVLQNTGPGGSKTAPDVKKVCFFANLWVFCAQPRSKNRCFRENPVFVKKRQKNALFWRKNSKKTRKKREKSAKCEKVTKSDVYREKLANFS